MLDFFRESSESLFIKLILGIIIIVFVFWGVGNINKNPANVVVDVNGDIIMYSDYQNAYENSYERARQIYQGQVKEYAKAVNLKRQVLDQLINEKLVLQKAQDNGFSVTDLELASWIRENEVFLTDGRFDKKKYQEFLRNRRTTEIQFEKNNRDRLLFQKFLQFITSNTPVSDSFLKKEITRNDTQIDLDVIEFTRGLFANQVKITDQEIKAYYDKNPAKFMQNKQFALELIKISLDDVKDKVRVKEKEIIRYYERNINSEFTTKDEFNSRHILISTPKDGNAEGIAQAKAKADKLYQQLKKNPSRFAILARENSDDPGSSQNGGNLGWVNKGSFVKEFEDTVNQLTPNEISRPFMSNFGFHIVQLIEKHSQRVQPLTEVKDNIEDIIRHKKEARRLKNVVAKMVKESAAKTIAELAKAYGKKVIQTRPFDQSTKLDNLSDTFAVYQSLKNKTLNATGSFKFSDGNTVLIYKVTEVIEPKIKPFDTVKERAKDFALSNKETKLSKTKLFEYAAKTKTAAEFKKLADTLKLKSYPVKVKLTDAQIVPIGYAPEFRDQVFKMAKKQLVKPISLRGRNYLVLKEKVTPGNIDNAERVATYKNQLKGIKTDTIIRSIIREMRKEAKLTFNPDLMKSLKLEFQQS